MIWKNIFRWGLNQRVKSSSTPTDFCIGYDCLCWLIPQAVICVFYWAFYYVTVFTVYLFCLQWRSYTRVWCALNCSWQSNVCFWLDIAQCIVTEIVYLKVTAVYLVFGNGSSRNSCVRCVRKKGGSSRCETKKYSGRTLAESRQMCHLNICAYIFVIYATFPVTCLASGLHQGHQRPAIPWELSPSCRSGVHTYGLWCGHMLSRTSRASCLAQSHLLEWGCWPWVPGFISLNYRNILRRFKGVEVAVSGHCLGACSALMR